MDEEKFLEERARLPVSEEYLTTLGASLDLIRSWMDSTEFSDGIKLAALYKYVVCVFSSMLINRYDPEVWHNICEKFLSDAKDSARMQLEVITNESN